jgi:hypothetical protein
MARRYRSREVEIFNFSFLDILACTIGLLIFIMVMVFILQTSSPIVDADAIAARKMNEAQTIRLASQRDREIINALEAQLDNLPVTVEPTLGVQRDVAKASRDQAEKIYAKSLSDLEAANAAVRAARMKRNQAVDDQNRKIQAMLDSAGARNIQAREALEAAQAAPVKNRVLFSAQRRPGGDDTDFQILHIDCRNSGVTVLRVADDGSVTEVGETAVDSLDDASSVFSTAVRRQQGQPNPLVLFWVRPDGMETFNAASRLLPAGMAQGSEPADRDWHFPGREGQ